MSVCAPSHTRGNGADVRPGLIITSLVFLHVLHCRRIILALILGFDAEMTMPWMVVSVE